MSTSPRAPSEDRWTELAETTAALLHNLRQPLSTVKLNLQLLAEDLGELTPTEPGAPSGVQGRAERRLETVRAEIDRLEAILRDFNRYAGRVNLRPREVLLDRLLEELAEFYRPQAERTGVEIRLGLPGEPVTAWADPDRLKEAVLNLMVNAQHAMEPRGGELLLRTRTEATNAVVEVADTGPGLSPEVLQNLFRVGFTTKPTGSGLGLPTVRRIVELHGGRISVHSEPGRGTCFTLLLPRNYPNAPDGKSTESPRKPQYPCGF